VAALETAAKEAAQRAAELRTRAAATGTSAAAVDPRAQRERLHERLTEKQSLLESARGVTERLAQSAEKYPGDKGLAAAAKLAAELLDKLAQDVAATTEELQRIGESSGTAIR
jgi:hypothetical protein